MDEETRALVAHLTARIADLEARLAALTSARTAPSPEPDAAPLSRRAVLRRSGAAAALGVGAAVGSMFAAQSAAAANGDPLRAGQTTVATTTTQLFGADLIIDNESSAPCALLARQSGISDFESSYPAGVCGESGTDFGVVGLSQHNIGVLGKTSDGTHAVRGQIGPVNSSWPGVFPAAVGGDAVGSYAGVCGSATTGHGVVGLSESGNGVYASSNSGAGVLAHSSSDVGVDASSGGAAAVRAEVVNNTGSGIALKGTTDGFGNALYAEATSTTSSNPAALAKHRGTGAGLAASSAKGIGATLSGGRAALRLVPKSTNGKPTSGAHVVGELVVDPAGKLYLCTVAGTPGTWKTVTVS